MNLLDLLGGPIKGIVEAVGHIVDDLHTSDDEKLEAKQKMLEVMQNFQIEMAKIDAEWAKTQAEVIKSESTSHSWLARNWRPLLMLTFTYIIAHNFIIAPLLSFEALPIPQDMWELLKLGMGGYIVGRSVEKVAPSVAEAITTVASNKKK